jgi:serine/threonine protein kinase
MGELMSVSGVDPRRAVGVLYLARAVGLIRAASESEPDMERPEEIDDLPPTTRPTLLEEMLALPDPPVRPRIIQPSPPSRAAWQPRGLEGSARRPEPTRRVATGQPVSEPLPVPEDGPALQMLARDGYKVQRIIGRGACGTVYQAYQERLERMVAVKVLASMGPDSTFRERFFREARSAARLNHPSIVTVFDCHGTEGVHYIVMELMEGTTLRDRVASEGPLAEVDALSVVASLAAALDHAHARSILHRDVKPENVFLSADGQVKLGDWGLAKPFAGDDASVTQTGWVVGTPNYIAPEQLKGLKEIDPRADIYSLGATFYFLLTACPPFEGPSVVDVLASHLLEPPPDPRVKRPEVSAASAALVAATMEKSPSGRPASARDVREEALRIRESLAG